MPDHSEVLEGSNHDDIGLKVIGMRDPVPAIATADCDRPIRCAADERIGDVSITRTSPSTRKRAPARGELTLAPAQQELRRAPRPGEWFATKALASSAVGGAIPMATRESPARQPADERSAMIAIVAVDLRGCANGRQ